MKKRGLGAILLLWLGVSSLITGIGLGELQKVDDTLKGGLDEAKARLASGNEAAVVSFVTGGAGTVTAHGSEAERTGDAEAILTFRFPGEDVEVAVFSGTSAAVLERGAGRTVTGEAPNGPGKCILHGHRDSAFAPMARLKEGDRLLLTTAADTVTYAVTEIYVTEPTDKRIYEPSDTRELELVTCYPFAFVGPAPERCVVVAHEVESA